MVSTTLLHKLEKLSPELQKKIEEEVDGLLNKNMNSVLIATSVKSFKIEPGFGGAKGFFGEMSDDFDAPIDDLKDYM